MKKFKNFAIMFFALCLSLGFVAGFSGLKTNTANAEDLFAEDGKYVFIYDKEDFKTNFKTSGENTTYYIMNDIDLENELWEDPVNFFGTIEGNGHTIYNFKAITALFNEVGAPIRNLNFVNVDITGTEQGSAGVIAAFVKYGRVENCTVSGMIKITGNNSVGGIAGAAAGSVIDCSVIGDEGSYITGTGEAAGGILGHAYSVINGSSEEVQLIMNNKVSGVTIVSDNAIGGIVGMLCPNDWGYKSKAIVYNNSCSNSIIGETGSDGNVGAIVGWATNAGVYELEAEIVDNQVKNVVIKKGLDASGEYDEEISGKTDDTGNFTFEGNTFESVQIVEKDSDAKPYPSSTTETPTPAADGETPSVWYLYVIIAVLAAATAGLAAYVVVLKKKSK